MQHDQAIGQKTQPDALLKKVVVNSALVNDIFEEITRKKLSPTNGKTIYQVHREPALLT